MSQEFHLPVKFPSLNDYIHEMNRNRHKGNAMKQEYTDVTTLLVKKGIAVKSPVLIEFTWYETNRKRDPDNIIFAKKFILDGLVNAGILPNDTQNWILGFTDRWVISPQPGVYINIEEIT